MQVAAAPAVKPGPVAMMVDDDDTETSAALDGFLPEFMRERLAGEAAMAAATKIYCARHAAEAYADMVTLMLFPGNVI